MTYDYYYLFPEIYPATQPLLHKTRLNLNVMNLGGLDCVHVGIYSQERVSVEVLLWQVH